MSVKLEDIQNISNEVSSIVRAGLPLESGLAQSSTAQLSRLASMITKQLEDGVSPDKLVSDSPDHATRMLTAAVAVGVRSGRLADSIELMGNLASDLIGLRRRVLQSLSYPLIVLLVGILLFMTWIHWFLGKAYDLMTDRGSTGGLLPRLIEFDQQCWWWPLAIPIAVLLVAAWWTMTGRASSMAFRGPERILLLLPGVGAVVRDLQFYLLTRLLTQMIERKQPLHESLVLAGACSGSAGLEAACNRAARQVEAGVNAFSPVQEWQQGQLPPLLAACLNQPDGNEELLIRRLEGIAGHYRRRLNVNLTWLRHVVPVAMFVIIGGSTVALFSLAFFWPVVEVYRSVLPV
ncbi:MAG TPA: hypothetical protein DCG12_02590 [Planctomycetaceae bacterium]|nr:hypothetical protein [Planctomycetaceae bacterium]